MHSFSVLVDKILYMFRTGPLSIIRIISKLYTRNRYLSCWFCWSLLEELILIILINRILGKIGTHFENLKIIEKKFDYYNGFTVWFYI